ncbi:YeiH family protein [Alkaliphilus serpentinus]|uniref:YeiH family putative sulfate export transporter n=1 Tax=Alkaliphilus serpentinus TaxID=1482731 RepID=A0A833ME14_9FIRM|nr:YeiH family protein [Alkaliphilus serpentinus]KAB3530044.1 YeiH family putative sulfate export transporter [Alkaliphilus serpentinus]
MNKIKELLPGYSLSLGIALISWHLGKTFTIIGGPVFAILIGMLIALIIKLPSFLKVGIKFSAKKMLQYAIILLGFQMNLFNVIKMGGQSLIMMIFTISSVFAIAIIVSRALRVEKKIATLVGVGTAICGGSAIAATAPVIMADEEDVASSISTIFLFNIIAVFIFPPLGRILGMNDTTFGIWSGLAINDTSSVVAAAQVWSPEALRIATIVKLTRTLMILPITLFLGVYTAKNSSTRSNISLVSILPWFIFGFLSTSVIATTNLLSVEATKILVDLGKLFIITAMAAIGLSTNLKQLMTNGIKPIILGFCGSLTVAIVAFVLIRILNFS